MREKLIDDGPGGRSIIAGRDGEPDRVANPLTLVDGSCTDKEKRLLLRFAEASEMSKGNVAVAMIEGDARGRYAEFEDRIDLETYIRYEVAAFRWIQNRAFGRESMTVGEIFARMVGDRCEVDFIGWGHMIAATDNPDIALGAAIGTTRSLAWALADAYRDFYDHWKARQEAARAGQQLSASDQERRIRRGDRVREAIRQYSRPIIDETA